MQSYSLAHLDDALLVRGLRRCFARENVNTAVLIAYLAETDARRLYAPAGYPSMHAWCVGEVGLSDDSAFQRITVARTARRFPVIFDHLARGRLNLSAVRLLAPHLTPENAETLLAEACGLNRSGLEALLARQSASVAPPTLPVCNPCASTQTTVIQGLESSSSVQCLLVPGRVEDEEDRPAPEPPTDVWPEERVVLQVAIPRRTHDDLRYLQSLLSHSIPSGDLSRVLHRAIQAAIREVERRKFAATTKPRLRTRAAATEAPARRTIPAHVRRAVWLRDGGRCTFIGDNGRVCGTRRFVEFDHVDPVARGGIATVETVRLRCHVHNQLEAERVYGRAFMEHKRQEQTRPMVEPTPSERLERERAVEEAGDVLAGLRNLGVRADEARRGAAYAESLRGVTLEERLRATLQFLRPPKPTRFAAVSASDRAGDGGRGTRPAAASPARATPGAAASAPARR